MQEQSKLSTLPEIIIKGQVTIEQAMQVVAKFELNR